MKTGIIGERGVGKSTVFHALTGLEPITGQADGKNRARFGQIKAPDPRLDFLEQIYNSRKKVHSELTVIDFAPNPRDQQSKAVLDPGLLPLIRDLDALVIVTPRFPGREAKLPDAIEGIESELVFADYDQAERRSERLKKEGGSDLERAALEKCLKWLETGTALRTLDLTAQELRLLSHFCFLSLKPALVVLNCEPEGAAAPTPEVEDALKARGLDTLSLAASFEAELWELGADERRELLAEAGLRAPARDRLIAALYRNLGLITFYTAGEPEAHAWPLRRGSSALEAAAKIHSDIAKGFIRAEVISFSDFEELRSEAKVKEEGKLRIEGRDYEIRDGDIIHIRFKV